MATFMFVPRDGGSLGTEDFDGSFAQAKYMAQGFADIHQIVVEIIECGLDVRVQLRGTVFPDPNPVFAIVKWVPGPEEEKPNRVDIKAILADPVKRRKMGTASIIATQAVAGITTTQAQAESAYDKAVAKVPIEIPIVSLEESRTWKHLDMSTPHPNAARNGWVFDTAGVWVKPPKGWVPPVKDAGMPVVEA